MIKLADVCFEYDKSNKVFDKSSAEIRENTITFIMGKSGSGKSTLLKLIGEILTPKQGHILFGCDVRKGYVFEEYGLLPWCNIEKNIGLAYKFNKMNSKLSILNYKNYQLSAEEKSSISEYCKKFDIDGIKTIYPAFISTGQRRRAEIIRALILNPNLLLLDEPFNYLDSGNVNIIMKALKESLFVKDALKYIVIASHSIEFAIEYADRVLYIQDRNIKVFDLNQDKTAFYNFVDKRNDHFENQA